MAYPVPARIRWNVMIEDPYGNVVYGSSDADLVERWARLMSWVAPEEVTVARLKELVEVRLDVFYQAEVVCANRDDDTAWLEALADTGVFGLSRK